MHGLSLPAPIGAAGRVQLPIAARCGFSSTFRPVNLPNVRRGATQDSRRRRRRRVWLQLAGHGGVVGQPWVILRAGGHTGAASSASHARHDGRQARAQLGSVRGWGVCCGRE